jgi:hypothetical protein
MKVTWSDVNNVQEAGHYPFRDGVIAILAMEIAIWRNRPDALFTLRRKNRAKPQLVPRTLVKPAAWYPTGGARSASTAFGV